MSPNFIPNFKKILGAVFEICRYARTHGSDIKAAVGPVPHSRLVVVVVVVVDVVVVKLSSCIRRTDGQTYGGDIIGPAVFNLGPKTVFELKPHLVTKLAHFYAIEFIPILKWYSHNPAVL